MGPDARPRRKLSSRRWAEAPRTWRGLLRIASFQATARPLTLAYGKLDPSTLGRLVALYEHRVFVEATVWNTNPFDQWGVELGKEMATNLLPLVQGRAARQADNSSTEGLLSFLNQHRRTESE